MKRNIALVLLFSLVFSLALYPYAASDAATNKEQPKKTNAEQSAKKAAPKPLKPLNLAQANTNTKKGNSSNPITEKPKYISIPGNSNLSNLKRTLSNFFPNEVIGVEQLNNSIALTGDINDTETATKAVLIANEFLKSNAGNSNVVNLMRPRTGQQVMLRVRVGEIQRTALKKIGFSLQGTKGAGNYTFPFSTGSLGTIVNPFGTELLGSAPFGTASVLYDSDNFDLSATLDLLEQDGLFKVLAEPNLVAISGEAANFFAGGEFPVPTPQQNNVISAEFKKFGVEVDFTPYVLAQDRIRLQVEPEVSELSNQGAVALSGFNIPAISSRRAKTTVELAPGESFMIAGLIKDEMRTRINELPGLGEIPVLSALFRSTAFQRNETELVIAVTPYLVNPVASSAVRLPTDGFVPPTVIDSLFFGALSGSGSSDVAANKGLEGPAGFIVE